MRKFTDGRDRVEVPGSTVRQIINNLDEIYPGMKDRLVENNRMRRSIAVSVDGVASRMGLLEKVKEDSEVHFLPAIAGG
ncbi:MAG: MoaD/ThiS family protein [Dehalococcoidia bacterium]